MNLTLNSTLTKAKSNKTMKIFFFLFGLGLLGVVSAKFIGTAQTDPLSCLGRCNQTGTIPNGCQCNRPCVNYGDCCADYYTLCLSQTPGSCAGKCSQVGTDPNAPCQCNKPCVSFGDCCPDYEEECGSSSGPITNAELEAFSEEIFALESTNNVGPYVTVNLNGPTLLFVDPLAYEPPTIKKFISLLDNYFAETSRSEVVTPEELQEETEFLDMIFDTDIMKKAQEFLESKGLPHGRASFYEMWFGMYSRGAANSSSGFEHIFLGELRNGVSGFHNWVFFARQEAAGNLTYARAAEYIDLGEKGGIIELGFQWHGQNKPVSSMYVATSPELELALTTVCFHARPSAKCTMSMGGNKFKIQTYTIGSNGQYVASGYPDLSD